MNGIIERIVAVDVASIFLSLSGSINFSIIRMQYENNFKDIISVQRKDYIEKLF